MTDGLPHVEVEWHPSDTFTLTFQRPNDRMRKDVVGPTGNKADFYKKTAQFLADLAAAGTAFTYNDHPGRA